MRVDVDEGEDLRDEARPHVLASHGSTRRRFAEPGLRQRPHLGETRVSADGQRSAADDLHPCVLLGIVRRGDADPAVERELGDRVVEHLGPDEAELDDVGARVCDALGGSLRHGG